MKTNMELMFSNLLGEYIKYLNMYNTSPIYANDIAVKEKAIILSIAYQLAEITQRLDDLDNHLQRMEHAE